MMKKIKNINALEILDSRGNPTVKAYVELNNGIIGEAAAPAGASTGVHEALELRDHDQRRFGGKGVQQAVRHVRTDLNNLLKGALVLNQEKIDSAMIELDHTKNKSRLGANAILAVSLACAKAGALAENLPLYVYLRHLFKFSGQKPRLPKPMMNILNGGQHADSGLSFQEYMIIPQRDKFKENLRLGSEIFHQLGVVLKGKGHQTLVGDEGGYAPRLSSHSQACEVIIESTKKAGYTVGRDIYLGLDAAASEFYKPAEQRYILSLEGASLSAERLIGLYAEWTEKYHLFSIEDGLAEDDWENWQILTKKLGGQIWLIGDDLFATNQTRLKRGIAKRVANSILIKPNQIGTLSETVSCVKLAKQNKYKVIISHRSGETCDTTIADLAVACQAEGLKSGSLSRSERLSKYNRLLEIEAELEK